MGAGPIGLGAVVALHGLGIPRVLAVDINPYRLDLAARLGAESVDGRSADMVALVRTW